MIIRGLHAIYAENSDHCGYTTCQRVPSGCTMHAVERVYPPLGLHQRYPDSPTSRTLLDGVSIETYAPQNIPLTDVVAERLAAVAARRWQVETKGVVVAGITIRTDRESQALINGACVASQSGILTSVDFKASSGWVAIPVAAMLAIGSAVALHVQACFSRERALAGVIDAAIADHPDDVAAAISAILGINIEEGWPT